MPSHVKRLTDLDGQHGATAFALTKPVNLARLDEEFAAATGGTRGLVSPDDPSTASVEHPVTVWATQQIDDKTLQKVVNAHDPKGTPDDLADLLAQIDAGEDLTNEEIRRALAVLIKRMMRGTV